ncbi:predicted protein [Uncinocarpus reesii 1704]|uniref:Uncharacterized protein n=1 Tax=Uncinocarpus reesii (strain UAMH 1704) TaxID=336963 RepID=C4JYX5_UNCRE|nr:uncharacterized protein UREG_07376 [Uncinocarpus reesii 1704]EEP82511.1 predicted protein [Uncinocarpus reesii 1704]
MHTGEHDHPFSFPGGWPEIPIDETPKFQGKDSSQQRHVQKRSQLGRLVPPSWMSSPSSTSWSLEHVSCSGLHMREGRGLRIRPADEPWPTKPQTMQSSTSWSTSVGEVRHSALSAPKPVVQEVGLALSTKGTHPPLQPKTLRVEPRQHMHVMAHWEAEGENGNARLSPCQRLMHICTLTDEAGQPGVSWAKRVQVESPNLACFFAVLRPGQAAI